MEGGMDALNGHGTGTFGDQLSAALLRELALSEHQVDMDTEEYKSASHPAAHLPHGHSQDATYLYRPGLGHKNGYMCALIHYAEGEMQELIDDDVDADSDDAGDAYGQSDEAHDERRQSRVQNNQRGVMSVPGTTTGAGTVLVPTDGEAEFSFRITRIPYDLPDLLPDRENTSTLTSLPSIPTTPSLVDDIFQPLSSDSVPDLRLELFSPPDAESVRGAPAVSAARIPPSSNTKERTPNRRFSFAESVQLDAPKGHLPPTRPSTSLAKKLKTAKSAASLGTAGTSSSDEPPAFQVRAAFSRLRNSVRSSRFMPEEDSGFLEKRSLTPSTLTSTIPLHSHQSGSSVFDQSLPPLPSSSSSITGSTDRVSTSSRSIAETERGWYFGRRKKKVMGAVFGVDLERSIEVAPARIRISHSGRSNSHRTFPLSVHKCCEFIRLSDSKDSGLFSSPGDAFHLDALRRVFTTAPDYGDGFTFEGTDYTIYDAARLILIYLTELPKPLVSRSVVKSWILLARQDGAIEPPCPQRIETGLDFWTEALNRLPVVNRNLVKHLLGLFADIVATKGPDGNFLEIGDANARQLSAAVSRALFHTDESDRNSKTAVHPTLALAFMIRKRGEYVGSLGKEKEKSSRSMRDSRMFLPTTKEIMQWKAPPSSGS